MLEPNTRKPGYRQAGRQVSSKGDEQIEKGAGAVGGTTAPRAAQKRAEGRETLFCKLDQEL